MPSAGGHQLRRDSGDPRVDDRKTREFVIDIGPDDAGEFATGEFATGSTIYSDGGICPAAEAAMNGFGVAPWSAEAS